MHPQLQLDGGGAAGGGPGGNNGSRRQLTGEADNGGSRSSSMRLVLQALLLSAGLQLSHAAPAAAAGRSRLVSKQDERLLPDWEMDAFIDQMWDLSGPILNNMGFSGLLGAASAAALKVCLCSNSSSLCSNSIRLPQQPGCAAMAYICSNILCLCSSSIGLQQEPVTRPGGEARQQQKTCIFLGHSSLPCRL